MREVIEKPCLDCAKCMEIENGFVCDMCGLFIAEMDEIIECDKWEAKTPSTQITISRQTLERWRDMLVPAWSLKMDEAPKALREEIEEVLNGKN